MLPLSHASMKSTISLNALLHSVSTAPARPVLFNAYLALVFFSRVLMSWSA